MYQFKLKLKIFVLIFPIILFISFLLTKILFNSTYNILVREDGLFEYSQAFLYFFSFILGIKIFLQFYKKKLMLNTVLYFILSLTLLFVCLEEISWGQRIFDINTPVYFNELNTQKEISFHNLKIIQPHLHEFYIFVGLYGTIGWIIFHPKISNIKMKLNHKNVIDYIVPEWFLSSYFFIISMSYYILEFTKFSPKPSQPPDFLIWDDQESVELILSLGFFLFLINIFFKIRSNKEFKNNKYIN